MPISWVCDAERALITSFKRFHCSFHKILTKFWVNILALGQSMKGTQMRKNFLVLLIALGAIFGSSTASFAEGNGENKASISAWKAENKAKLDGYKAALDNYLAAKTANEAARKAIAAKFKTDADALRANTKAAVDSAATTEAKKAATRAGKEALEKLIADRKAALEALPKPGVKPVKPTLAPRPAKPSPKASPSTQG